MAGLIEENNLRLAPGVAPGHFSLFRKLFTLDDINVTHQLLRKGYSANAPRGRLLARQGYLRYSWELSKVQRGDILQQSWGLE